MKEKKEKGPDHNYVIDITCTDAQLRHIIDYMRMIKIRVNVQECDGPDDPAIKK